ncbi:MAG: tRNA preQ1(34) S-adenosylmethionine ribosyltransferase-isomerase QueA [bacterium]|jgi:S-adenosylmethionine:tRNA ribosyltransferase-isomerase|nr:tRNA preQ1(34) S-adenosylmethionine ribosyltransferase-isomerase QueA [Betaproteobacteria bacterium]
MRLSDFDYLLPPELIAQTPSEVRGASRLLCVGGPAGPDTPLADRSFTDLPSLLDPGDLLVFNDTRVVKARLFGSKATGGRVEVLVERVLSDDRALVHLRASKSPKPGMVILFGDDADPVRATMVERRGALFLLAFDPGTRVLDVLERHGEIPLPPYIERKPELMDASRYQTVFAREPGAVAASTAGLHFDAPLLAALDARGVRRAFLTLHIGAGTFQPVRDDDLSKHVMHHEAWSLPQATVDAIAATRAAGGRVIAVGTTVVRTLESVAARSPDRSLVASSGETDLFITPGFRFRVVDRMVTNFHLPKSTLLMLVSAFAGVEPIRQAYAHAVAQRYRFFSYGDAMLLSRRTA